ncbi:MAG: hypothetical protein JNL67_06300 [Planctomycetaceae bacterium]|nr:hypothetical protein [Planctomycetaceae bacterium]
MCDFGNRRIRIWSSTGWFMCGWAWACFWLTIQVPDSTLAGLGPENCVLVINGDLPESREVAAHYAELRKFHSRNLIVLRGVPVGESCSVADFTEKVLKPIFQQISERKLDAQVHCIIYSTGFPTKIDFSAWAKDVEPPLAVHQTPVGSLTSMTYLYRWTLSQTPAIIGLDTNHYARRGPTAVLDFPLTSQAGFEKFSAAKQLYSEGKWTEAQTAFAALLKDQPFQCGLAYWQCRCYAKAGDATAAAQALIEAARRGWRFKSFTEADPDLADLAKTPPFQATLKAMSDSYWDVAIPLAFSAQTDWSVSGFPEKVEQSPHRYILSTSLGVVGDHSKTNTVDEILSYLKKSATADHTSPKGKFYFSSTKDVRTTTRLPNMPAAVNALNGLGFSSEMITTDLPQNAKAVLGVTIGAAGFDWRASNSKFQAGAIGDNLTSYGAVFDKGHSQTTIAEFLRAGVAGASGTVVEPYAIQNKFPYPMIHAYYARGFSLAEAFYMSVNGPYQLLVVGDALCQPFAKPPSLDVKMGSELDRVKGSVPIQLSLRDSSPLAQRFDVYMDGLRVGTVAEPGQIRIDTTKHPDGYHELRFVAIGSDSPQSTSREIVPLQFNNHGHEVNLEVKVLGENVQVKVKAQGADSVQVLAFHELVGEKNEGEFEVTLPTSQLGAGPIVIQALANYGDQVVASPPRSVNVAR